MSLLNIVFFLALLFSSTLLASDSETEETSSYSEEEESLLAVEMLEDHLATKQSVRFQINALLKYFQSPFSVELLLQPVLCIGTGLDKDRLNQLHIRPTWMCQIDFSIDLSSRIGPNLIADGFQISEFRDCLPHRKFGVVFFAHVGTVGLPINDAMNKSLDLYSLVLQSKGFFIYASEVFASEAALDEELQVHHVDSFPLLEEKWRNLLSERGFMDIKIAKRDELKGFGTGAVSLVILGRKS